MSLEFAGIQHRIEWEQPQRNFERLRPIVHRAAEGGAELIALTEMYSNGFSMDTAAIAETPDGPSTAFLTRMANETGAWVCGSVPERRPGMALPHNCLVLAGPDATVHRYAKIHRFAYAGEDQHYEAGDEPAIVTINGVRTSLHVCFDLRFAPDFWTIAADVDFYLLVANWPAARSEHWTTLLRARAIENLAYVAGVNRVGAAGDGLAHSGDSRVFGPFGEVVAAAEPDVECIVTATIDSELVATTRRDYPFLDERV